MREVVLQMHVTLDGAADTNDGFVPITDRPYWMELDAALAETAAAEVDTLLLGKVTSLQSKGYWRKAASAPSTPADLREQARGLDETPKVVFSKSLVRADWRGS